MCFQYINILIIIITAWIAQQAKASDTQSVIHGLKRHKDH